MRHFASPDFWKSYQRLPVSIQNLADKNFQLLKANRFHVSLQFKKVGRYRSARIGSHYRTLAVEREGDLVWFWIGSHAEYDQLLRR